MDSHESSNKNFKSHKELVFPNRFKSFPVVVSTCFWLSENYNKLKESNYVTKCTCYIAESTIKNSIDFASPLLEKFKDKVDVLDSLVCNQLDKLEAAFPIIKSDPDTLVTQGKELMSTWGAHTTSNRISSLIANRAQLVSLLSNQTHKLSQNLNKAIKVLKAYILDLFKFMEMYKSMRKNVYLKLQDRLYVTREKIDLYKEYLDLLSKQFTVQDGRSLEHVNSLEERTKIIVRRNIGNVITILRILYAKLEYLKPLIEQNRLSLATRQIIHDIFQILHKPDGSLIDLLNNLLVECSRTMNLASKVVHLNSSIIHWIVPNFDAFGVLDGVLDDDDEEFVAQTLKLNKAKSLNFLDGTAFDTDTELPASVSRYTLNSYGSNSFSSSNITDSCSKNNSISSLSSSNGIIDNHQFVCSSY